MGFGCDMSFAGEAGGALLKRPVCSLVFAVSVSVVRQLGFCRCRVPKEPLSFFVLCQRNRGLSQNAGDRVSKLRCVERADVWVERWLLGLSCLEVGCLVG